MERGTVAPWYAINMDGDGNPMILVYAWEQESRDDQFGWIDCRYIDFDPEEAVFEENESDQRNLAMACELVDIDD